ncbi:hypothetical protein [Dechloromonas sp. H13]|uniref:hypothetical protein n=1 Tax=Dechloromonas sp. H13 TaxID=2570193 RepID=UPI0012909B8E|nr:hypothetical protein [Dechloromonas sp. H13]
MRRIWPIAVATFIAVGMTTPPATAEEPDLRPLRQYGPYKEVALGEQFQLPDGPEKRRLNARCEQLLGSTSFNLYQFQIAGKKVILIADWSGDGQNFHPTDHAMVNVYCKPLGKRPATNMVNQEPEGSYHFAAPILDAKGDLAYFLTEVKYGPSKYCAFLSECKKMKGYTYARDLYKATGKGFELVSSAKKNSPVNVDVDKLLPLNLN